MSLRSYSRFESRLGAQYRSPAVSDLARDPDCIICRDPNDAASSLVMPCGHVFHADCLKSWIMQKQSCPTCNKSLLDEEPRESQGAEGEAAVSEAAAAVREIARVNVETQLRALGFGEEELPRRVEELLQEADRAMQAL